MPWFQFIARNAVAARSQMFCLGAAWRVTLPSSTVMWRRRIVLVVRSTRARIAEPGSCRRRDPRPVSGLDAVTDQKRADYDRYVARRAQSHIDWERDMPTKPLEEYQAFRKEMNLAMYSNLLYIGIRC